MKDKNITLLRFVNLTAYAAMVVVNYLAARLPINGITPGAAIYAARRPKSCVKCA